MCHSMVKKIIQSGDISGKNYLIWLAKNQVKIIWSDKNMVKIDLFSKNEVKSFDW